MDYIRAHWRGDQTLMWTFWVNVVALRAVILYVERFTHPPFIDQSSTAIVLTALYFVVFQLFVFAWQAHGLIKACDTYLKALGSYMTVLSAQMGLGICLIVTVIYVAGAVQSLFADPEAMQVNQRLKNRSPLSDYTLSVSDDGTRVHLNGDLRIGITEELARVLGQHTRVGTIVLTSNGGRVIEGRGLARLIGEKRLHTHVPDMCKSACTTAFIGGVNRTLGPQGKLGFHQFSLDAVYPSLYVNAKEEQNIDLAFYARQKIDPGFLEKIFQTSSADMWFPHFRELLAAGVVHKIVN